MKKLFNSQNAAAAVGPYSHGAIMDGLLMTSGQIPLNLEGAIVDGGITAQTEQAINNLEAVLAEQGYSLQDVVKTVVFLTDLGNFGTVNGIYEKRFAPNKPARSCVQVSALPKGALVEIEAVAFK